jgi:hypothetical protein
LARKSSKVTSKLPGSAATMARPTVPAASGSWLSVAAPSSFAFVPRSLWLVSYDRGQCTYQEKDMALERGDRVIFTKSTGGFPRPLVRKGTEGTVTKAGWWGLGIEVTLENGKKLTVSRDEISKIGRKKNWWWWPI